MEKQWCTVGKDVEMPGRGLFIIGLRHNELFTNIFKFLRQFVWLLSTFCIRVSHILETSFTR